MSTLTGFTFSEQMDLVAEHCGATISLEDLAGITCEIPYLRLRSDQYYHYCDYCENAKKADRSLRCVKSKYRSLKKADRFKKPYYGYCPNGIWDMVYPVFHETRMVCCLYLGALKKDRPIKQFPDAKKINLHVPEWTQELEDKLRNYAEMLVTEIKLIMYAWLKDGNRLEFANFNNEWHKEIHRYIVKNYRQDICLSDLSKRLKLHPDYLGKLIKNSTGFSFRQLLQQYRISRAKNLLIYPEHSISEIAYLSGFSDSNYFSSVFSKSIGMSPREFRKISVRSRNSQA